MKISKELLLANIEKQYLFLFPLMVVLFSPSKELMGILSLPDIFTYFELSIFLVYILLKGRVVKNFNILFLILLIAFSFVSLVYNESGFFIGKLKYQLRWYNYFITFIIAINYVNQNNFFTLKKGLFFATYLVCIYGILQTIFIEQFLQTIFWKHDFPDYILESFRTYSTFDNPLNLCAFLAFPLGFLQHITPKQRNDKILLGLIYTTLILTASKIAIVMILVTGLVYFRKHIRIILYTIVASLTLVLIISLSNELQTKLMSFNIYERVTNSSIFEGSVNQRKYVLVSSVNMIRDNPVLGIGYENFGKVYLNGYKHKLADDDETFFTAENFFLDFYLDNGLIPTLIIFGFFIQVFLLYFISKNPKDKILSFPIILFLVCGMIMSARSAPLLFFLFFFMGAFFKLKSKYSIRYEGN